jgi:hypothetical protein
MVLLIWSDTLKSKFLFLVPRKEEVMGNMNSARSLKDARLCSLEVFLGTPMKVPFKKLSVIVEKSPLYGYPMIKKVENLEDLVM